MLDLSQQVNEALNLTASKIFTLHLDRTPAQPVVAAILIDGEARTLSLWPHSVRSPIYKLLAQVEDGSIVELEPGPERTLRGELLEVAGSRIAGSMLDDGLHALILMPDGRKLWIEPLVSRIAGIADDQYVLYDNTDVIGSGGVCGVEGDGLNVHADEGGEDADPQGGIAGGSIYCTQLGVDADFEFYQSQSSSVTNVQNSINNIINAVNLQYESEAQIRHVITTILVRTAEPDPYSSTSAGTLLNQFQAEWNNNQGSIQRDVAHLFTGKNLNGGTIGIAQLGVICVLNQAYSLVQPTCCGSFACKTDLSSHELGHNWNAGHCTCGSPAFTMNPSLLCANVHAAGSITQIINHRNSRTCLALCEDGTATLPFSDDFPTTVIDPAKWTGISGAQSNATGLNEPSPPNSLNLDGSASGGDQVRSAIINTAALSSLTLQYSYQRRGGGDSPESGEDLVIEYLNSSDSWVELHRQLGSGPDMTTYQPVAAELPSAAFHQNFRLRFRAISTTAGNDDWFVDNVQLTGFVPPVNNTCVTAPVIGVGTHPFSTLGATTTGLIEPACNLNGVTQIDKDIWYRYFSPCTGEATFSVCDADFDAKIAVYHFACPTVPGTTLACEDNVCGDGPTITIPVQFNNVYRIRLGGVNGASGTGALVITCGDPPPPPPTCDGDINEDGMVNVDDLLLLLGSWGSCVGCLEDLNNTGIVDVDDLLLLLGGWGPCPE